MISYIVNEYDKYKVLDICGESVKPGAALILYKYHGGENQLFEIRGNNIISVKSNLVLGVKGNLEPGSVIEQQIPNGSDKQKFYFMRDGTIQTVNGLCLENKNPKSSDKNQMALQYPDGRSTQKFVLASKL